MGLKKLLERIDEMEVDNRILLFIFLILGMFAGNLYIGVLIIPNWYVFIEYPWIYQLVSYSVIGLICLDISFVVIITIKTAIRNQILIEINTELEKDKNHKDKKIEEMEKELKRLQGNR